MRQLKNVVVKGVALVKRPANRKPIHLYKNQGGSVPDTSAADASVPSAESGVLESAAPEEILKSIEKIALSKGDDSVVRDTLMGIAHLLHNSPNVSMADLVAAGQAAGLGDELAKASSKAKADEDDDEDEEQDEIEDEDEDEEEEDAENTGKVGDATDKLPPALRAKAREKQKKSAGESQAKGDDMPAELEKSEQVTITKAEHQVMMQRLEKAEREWRRHEAQAILKSIKEENQAALPSLSCDHDKLAVIVKAIKDRDPAQAAELTSMLKGFDAQVGASAAGSIFKSRATPNGAAPSQGYTRFTELVKAEQKRSGCSEGEATLRVAKTAEGNSAFIEHQGAN